MTEKQLLKEVEDTEERFIEMEKNSWAATYGWWKMPYKEKNVKKLDKK